MLISFIFSWNNVECNYPGFFYISDVFLILTFFASIYSIIAFNYEANKPTGNLKTDESQSDFSNVASNKNISYYLKLVNYIKLFRM